MSDEACLMVPACECPICCERKLRALAAKMVVVEHPADFGEVLLEAMRSVPVPAPFFGIDPEGEAFARAVAELAKEAAAGAMPAALSAQQRRTVEETVRCSSDQPARVHDGIGPAIRCPGDPSEYLLSAMVGWQPFRE